MKNFIKKILARSHRFNCYLGFKSIISNNFLDRIVLCALSPIAFFCVLIDSIFNLKETNLKYELSAVLIMKNEGKYIKEWLNYYHLLGFEKIYVFDNESNDDTYEVLMPFIKKGYVEYHQIKGKARQMDAYNKALNISRKETRYLAILDADEFIFLPNENDDFLIKINKLFHNDSHVGGVVINWLIFGSSGYKKKPNGLVTQTYMYHSKANFKINKHVKTICNPRKVAGVLNPHYVEYNLGMYSVNTNGDIIRGAFSEYNPNTSIRLNHYFTKSKEEFIKKRARGMADQNKIRSMSDFNLHDRNEIFDDSMKRYGDILNRME